ncbi:MAG: hypothetical protein JW739_08090 [Opitutales bacterium]|nr:hypothetical protein [Opitutales bacterium]
MTRDLPSSPEAAATEPCLWGIDGTRTSTNEKGIVLPYIAGHRKVALKWISPAYDYWTKNIKETVAKDVFCTIAGAICHGPINRINKIYYGGDVILKTGYTFRYGQASQTILTDMGSFTVYRGTVDQPYDSYLQGKRQAWSVGPTSQWNQSYGSMQNYIKARLGESPTATNYSHGRYPGVAYVICSDLSCGRNSSSVPNIEVSVSRSVQVPEWLNIDTTLASNGCNPIAILAELLTRPELGVELQEEDINVAAWETLAGAFQSNKLRYYLSALMESLQTADKAIEEVLAHVDGFQANRNGKLSLGFFPKDGVTPYVSTLSAHEMTEVPKMTLPDWAKTSNRVVVKYPDLAGDFENESVDAKSSYNRKIQGRIVSKSLEAKFIVDAAQALTFANEQVEMESLPEDTGRISVLAHEAINPDGTRMQPGDRFRILYAPWELNMICRITEVAQKSLGAVQISFVRERGLFAQSYETLTEPAYEAKTRAIPPVAHARVFELTQALAESSATWIGVVAEQPAGDVAGYALWYSSNPGDEQTRSFDSLSSSAYWAGYGQVAEDVTGQGTAVLLYCEQPLDDFDVVSRQGQLDDTLLLLIDDEILSVGQWSADPDNEGYYEFSVLRGRKGTKNAEHVSGAGVFLFYKDQLLKVTHGSFSTDDAPQFKLQSIGVKGAQELSDALLISEFSFAAKQETESAWISASDLNFTTSYNESGVSSTTPSVITLTCLSQGLNNPTYTWQKYESGSWNTLEETSNELSLSPGSEGRYHCVTKDSEHTLETTAVDINRITEAPSGTTPLSCGALFVGGKQVVGARLPGISLNLDLTINGVDGAESNAASQADVQTAIEQIHTTLSEILDRLGSASGHGLIE